MGIKKSTESKTAEEQTNAKKITPIKLKMLATLVIISIILLLGIVIGYAISNKVPATNSDSPIVDNAIINVTPDVDVTYLNTALNEACEVTTAKLKINGLVDFKDTGLIILR